MYDDPSVSCVFCCKRYMLRVYLAVLGIIVTTEGDAKLPKVGASPSVNAYCPQSLQ